MAGLEGLLGNNTLAQIVIYNLVGQLLAPLLAPYSQALANDANANAPQVPLSPADFALAVIRNIRTISDGAAEAAKSGINAADFATLVAITGDAPAPGEMAEALRRGFVDEATFERGIREGRLRDEWIPLVKQLATASPTPSLALQAALEGQTDMGTAQALYAKFGGDPQYFQLAFDTEGSSPSPVELGVMANRGLIPWSGTGAGAVSFDQGFLEGPWRNKWSAPMRELAVYLPPPRTVTAMLREGAITDAQATHLLEQTGLSPELAAAYIHAAHTTKTSHARELSQATVLKAYADGIMAAGDVHAHLSALSYSDADVAVIMSVEDMQIAFAAARSTVSRAHNLYTAHKITRSQAQETLGAAKVPAANMDRMLTLWDLERADNHKVLTAGEIAGAFYYSVIEAGEATTLLTQLGYSAFEAWLILSVRNKGAVPGRPGMDPQTDMAGG